MTYTNKGKTPIAEAKVIDPVPVGTTYVLDSAEGKGTEIFGSIDGGKSFLPFPVIIETKKSDGTVERQVAPAKLYTHIRWMIKKIVQPSQSGSVSLKVTVN